MERPSSAHFYVGTQCDGPGTGIFDVWLDESTGRLSEPRLVAETARPTWLLRHPRLSILYAVSEVGNRDAREGELLSFDIDKDGNLQLRNRIPAGGGGPTHLTIDREGRALFVANFGGGQAVCVPLAQDGRLVSSLSIVQQEGSGPHRRQTKAHPHGVTLDPSRRFLLVPDMGADRLFIHRYDVANRSLVGDASRAIELPAGSGPRLAAFGLEGRFLYLLSELSAELFVFGWDPAEGRLEPVHSLPLENGEIKGEPSAAALAISGDGRFLYVSNRRKHAIQAYAIDGGTGMLHHVQDISSGGERPWNAELAPNAQWLLVTNQGNDTVVVFERDCGSGRLGTIADSTMIPTPTCIAFSGLRR